MDQIVVKIWHYNLSAELVTVDHCRSVHFYSSGLVGLSFQMLLAMSACRAILCYGNSCRMQHGPFEGRRHSSILCNVLASAPGIWETLGSQETFLKYRGSGKPFQNIGCSSRYFAVGATFLEWYPGRPSLFWESVCASMQ